MRAPQITGEAGRPHGRPGRDTQQTPTPIRTADVLSVADGHGGVVADLNVWRWRPWPGWWGSREMACWSFAERSRRIA